jgi:hypothetical protein
VPYWYSVTATHGPQTSAASTATLMPTGWNPGGWQ